MEYLVNTIYPSFMGEVNEHGIGAPCVFIRLNGCNLRCYEKTMGHSCDTKEALTIGCGTKMTTNEIVQKVLNYKTNLVCITGGEPLMQDIVELTDRLNVHRIFAVIETNGTKPIIRTNWTKNVSFVVDYKCPSTGENSRMCDEAFRSLNSRDFIKFVVNDETDLATAKKWITEFSKLHGPIYANLAIGLYWGSQLIYNQLLRFILEAQKSGVHLHLNFQAHKLMRLYDDTDSKQLSEIFIPKEL